MTNGFREIDFSNMECKDCGKYHTFFWYNSTLTPASGKVYTTYETPNPFGAGVNIKQVLCSTCEGKGFIDISTTETLELG